MKPNKALLHICHKITTLSAGEARRYLEKMGWTYLSSGSYKTAYQKRGVPFVLKICHSGRTWNDRQEDEFLLSNLKKPLPSVFYGQTLDGHWFGLQERCRYTFDTYLGELKCKYIRRKEAKAKRKDPDATLDYDIRNGCYDHASTRIWKSLEKWFDGNPDYATANCGITYDGRPVQFD